jgi:hypothetical protein
MAMKPLTDLEMEILLPGPPGAGPYPDELFAGLVARGCAEWLWDPIECDTFFTPTAAGLAAIEYTRASKLVPAT